MISARALYRTLVCFLVSWCAYIALSGCSNNDVKPECRNHVGSWLSSVPGPSDPACITTSPEKAENFALYLLSFIFGRYLERAAFRHALSALSVYLYLVQFSSPSAGQASIEMSDYHLHEALQVLVALMWALHPLVAVQTVCGGWLGMNPYAWYALLSLFFVGTYKRGTLLHAYNALSAAYFLYYAVAADVADAVAWPTAVSVRQAISAVPSLPSSYWTALAHTWTARLIHPPASALVPYGWEGQEVQGGSGDVVHMLRVLAIASACALALSQALVWLTCKTGGSPAQRGPPMQGANSRGRALQAASSSSSSSSSSVSEAPSNPQTAVHTSPPSSLAGYLPSPTPLARTTTTSRQSKGQSPARALAHAGVPGSASSMASYASVAASGGRRRAGSTATTGKGSRAPSLTRNSTARASKLQATTDAVGASSSSSSSGGGSDSADLVPLTPLSQSTAVQSTHSGGSETHAPMQGDLVHMYHTGLLYTLACLLLHDAAHAIHAGAAWSAGGATAVPHPAFSPSDLYLPLACGAILCLSSLLQALQGAVYRRAGTAAAALYVALVAAGLLWIVTRRSVPLIGVWSDPLLLWDALVHTREMGTHPAAHLAYAHALAAAAAVAGNASMLTLAMAQYESARSLALLSSPSSHGQAVLSQANGGLSELTLGTFVNATAALTAWEAGSMASPSTSHSTAGREGGAAAASAVLQARYTEAWEAAVHAHRAVVHAVAWHEEGSGHMLSPEEIVLKEVLCGTVGRATVPRVTALQELSRQGSDRSLLQHAHGYANAGDLMAVAAARSSGELGQHVSGSEAVEAWERAATLLALHVAVLSPKHTHIHMGQHGQDKRHTVSRSMHMPGSTLSAADVALSLGDNLRSSTAGGGLYSLALRVYEIGLQAAAATTAASAPALHMLQAVTKAVVVRQHGSRSGGHPLSLPFVYVPSHGVLSVAHAGTATEEGSAEAQELAAAHTAAFHDSGIVRAIRWADPSHPLLPNSTTLATMTAERAVPPPVCVEHRVTARKAIRTTAPASWVTYERAVAELRALLVASAPNSTGGQDEAWFARLLHESPVCMTAHEWESDCGKVLILANRAATVAAEAARLASREGAPSTSPLCTCTPVQPMDGTRTGDGGPGPGVGVGAGVGHTVRLCAQQDTTSLLQDEPTPEHTHTEASVLGLHSSPLPSCGRVDGVASPTLPAALAGWMHCAVESAGGLSTTLTTASCTATQQELSFVRALESLLPLYAPSSRSSGSVSMARALLLSARAHALTLLAVRYQLPGAPRPPLTLQAALGPHALPAVTNSTSPAGRALVQALHASRAGLSMLTEACGCE